MVLSDPELSMVDLVKVDRPVKDAGLLLRTEVVALSAFSETDALNRLDA